MSIDDIRQRLDYYERNKAKKFCVGDRVTTGKKNADGSGIINLTDWEIIKCIGNDSKYELRDRNALRANRTVSKHEIRWLSKTENGFDPFYGDGQSRADIRTLLDMLQQVRSLANDAVPYVQENWDNESRFGNSCDEPCDWLRRAHALGIIKELPWPLTMEDAPAPEDGHDK